MTDFDDTFSGPSKTQRKQEMHELQDLGPELLKLSAAQLGGITMDERLREALREHGRMPTREARRRHMQFIGRLLRETDAEPVRRGLEAIRAGEARVLAEAERWREELLAEDAAMTAWVADHPESSVQALRQLIRQTRRELADLDARHPDGQAPRGNSRAYKTLFQTLRVALQAQQAAASATRE